MNDHYLLLKKYSLAEWRAHCQTTHKARFERLRDQAESYLTWLPPAEHPDDSITFIGMAVANLALTYLLTEEERYLDGAQRWIEVAINYPHWGKNRLPDHDLDAAWLLFGLGLGYDWLKQHMTANDRSRLRAKLLLQGRRLYEYAFATEGRWWSSAFWQNHNWICHGGLAAAAYALQDERREVWVWSERALDNFRTALPLMPEDGSGYEGPVYWRYGFPWFLIYCDLLEQQTGVDLHDSAFLRNAFYYRLYLSAPNLIDTANFGDCHDRRSAHSAAVYYRLASLYRLGHAQWLADHFYETGEWAREAREGLVKPGAGPEAFLEFLWYDPSISPEPIDTLPLVRAFPDMGLISARTGWGPDATFLAFKCGTPSGHKSWALGHALDRAHSWDMIKASHAHPDENSFILVRGADYLAVDEGYSQKKLTRHHSTVLVNGHGQYHEGAYNSFAGIGPEWGGRLEDWFVASDTVYMRGEAAPAYAPELGLTRFSRQIVFFDGQLLLMCDDLAAEKPCRFEWLLQTDVPATPVNERCAHYCNGDSRLFVQSLLPEAVCSAQMEQEVTANPTSAKPDWILRHTLHTLSLSPETATTGARFLNVLGLRPFEAQALPAARGSAFQLTMNGRHYLCGFATNTGLLIEDQVRTDARWILIEREDNSELLRLGAGDTTRIWLGERLLCFASNPTHVALTHDSVRRVEWTVNAARPTWLSLWVPMPPRAVLLNGAPIECYFDILLSMIRLQIPAERTVLEMELQPLRVKVSD